jgi:hypothetical protein
MVDDDVACSKGMDMLLLLLLLNCDPPSQLLPLECDVTNTWSRPPLGWLRFTSHHLAVA